MAITIEEHSNVAHVIFNGRRFIDVYPPRKEFGSEWPAEINWSAIGSVPVAEAKEFIEGLQKAVEIAERFNETR